MEKPSKHGSTSKQRHGGGGTSPGDGGQHFSGPRSKVKDKNPQSGYAERRYKEMLHTTSHIYQPMVASGLNETPEESRVPNQSTLLHTKESVPARQERILSTGGISPEDITADVPLIKIMSKDQPASPAVTHPGENPVISALEGKAKNIVVPTENSVADDSSLQEKPTENSLVDHGEQAGSTSCRRHSFVHLNSKPRSLISRPKLCESCTVSMLSYIAMLRDMLDEVTNEITNQEVQTIQCAECVKERVIQRNQAGASSHDEHVSKDVSQRPHDLPLSKQNQIAEQFATRDHTSLAARVPAPKGIQQDYQQIQKSTEQQPAVDLPLFEKPDLTLMDEITASSRNFQDKHTFEHPPQSQPDFALSGRTNIVDIKTDRPFAQSDTTKWADVCNEGRLPDSTNWTDMCNEESLSEQRSSGTTQSGERSSGTAQSDERSSGTAQYDPSLIPRKHHEKSESLLIDHSETPDYVTDQSRTFFGDAFRESGEVPATHPPSSDQRPWQQEPSGRRDTQTVSAGKDFHSETSTFFQDRGESDGILSTLSNEEREVYDSARGRAGWERLTDSQDYRDTSFGPSSTEEAFVTMATTNAEAISCLVLGSSLLLCRTTRTLCVLVTDGVSPSLRAPLASVFQVVQSVRSLDTVGTTKVALLDQPELGIFFRKLHVWRLVQFSKCVFLNPDTLVLQSSDELFCHEELSAVPDIGWPDCFNSGVFVFQPSVETFWKLVEFAESEGSYDGGDQGLLNAFFKTWSKDIHKKLSFIYNLMANVSYTYTPAFKQFGRNVKIVQFQGAFKPWHVKFYTGTGQIAPSTAVHPTYVQFVHVWLNIFRVRVLPLFSQDIQSFASSRNIVSASELLKFYPSPVENEADFLLTPPSVRVRPDPLGITKQPSIMRRHSIGSAKELKREQKISMEEERVREPPTPDDKGDDDSFAPDNSKSKDVSHVAAAQSEPSPSSVEEPLGTEEELPYGPQGPELNDTDVVAEGAEDDGSRRSSIPGSEIGDYHGMAAWEQGRMDYMGSACSENIIKRLHFLMDKPGDTENPD